MDRTPVTTTTIEPSAAGMVTLLGSSTADNGMSAATTTSMPSDSRCARRDRRAAERYQSYEPSAMLMAYGSTSVVTLPPSACFDPAWPTGTLSPVKSTSLTQRSEGTTMGLLDKFKD